MTLMAVYVCRLSGPRLQVAQVQAGAGALLPPAPLWNMVPGMCSTMQCLHWPLLGAGLGGRLGVLQAPGAVSSGHNLSLYLSQLLK